MQRENQRYFYFIILVVGFVFLRSGWGKVTGGKFAGSLAGTLAKFAEKNPHLWYKDFLQNVAIPNAATFALLTMWGEVLTGFALMLTSTYLLFKRGTKLIYFALLLASFGGMFLNATFWLAAGYTSASTESVNLIMFFVESTGLIFALSRLLSSK